MGMWEDTSTFIEKVHFTFMIFLISTVCFLWMMLFVNCGTGDQICCLCWCCPGLIGLSLQITGIFSYFASMFVLLVSGTELPQHQTVLLIFGGGVWLIVGTLQWCYGLFLG